MNEPRFGSYRRSPKQAVAIVLLVLMAMVLSFVGFPVAFGAEWLKYDLSGVVSVLTTLLYGSWVGIGVAAASWIPHLVTDPLGASMNIINTVSLIVVAGSLYRRKPGLSHAVLGCLAGIAVSVVVSICLNFVVTPLYTRGSYQDVLSMVLPIILPFNLFKGLLNSLIAIVSFRKLAILLKESGAAASALDKPS